MNRTILDMIHLCYRAVAFCQHPTCARVRLDGGKPNGFAVDISKVDPDWPVERFEAALTCVECGMRSIKVVWEQVGQPSVYWTEDVKRERAERSKK